MTDVFRKNYETLSYDQKTNMDEIKTKAEELWALFEKAVPSTERSEKSRCMAIARTNLEQSIMWAVKGVTTTV